MSNGTSFGQSGDDLVEQLLAGANDGPALERATYDLLNEIFAGYPVEELQRLLQSSEPTAVKAGAWILSELGYRAAPMMNEITGLLEHSLRYVRFFAVDAVLASATEANGSSIARVVSLIGDPEEAVRWKVLRFLAQATTAQLASGAQYLTDRPLEELTRWLTKVSGETANAAEVLNRLEDSDHLVRMFASAAAARLAKATLAPLERASLSSDAEVQSFALDELQIMSRSSERA